MWSMFSFFSLGLNAGLVDTVLILDCESRTLSVLDDDWARGPGFGWMSPPSNNTFSVKSKVISISINDVLPFMLGHLINLDELKRPIRILCVTMSIIQIYLWIGMQVGSSCLQGGCWVGLLVFAHRQVTDHVGFQMRASGFYRIAI